MPLRWGIVSAGLISHDFVTAFNSYPDVGDQVIIAVAARDKKRAIDFANLHNINKVFDSYESLAKSSDIDVAYIGTVNTEHHRIARLFLENGKHVLCEKPLCMNFKQAQCLINMAKKEKLFLMEAVWSRFSPAYQSLEKEVQSGQLGDPKFVEVNFGLQIESVERLWKKSLGGGAALDIGIYALQFAQYIFKDEPLRVTAVGKLNTEGVDTAETIILEYSEDRKAVLNVDTTLKLWNKATVVGAKGRATLEDSFHFPDSLIHADGSIEKFQLHLTKHKINFHNSAGLVYQALEVCRCIKSGLLESPRMSHDDSLVLAKLEDMVRKQLGVHYDVDDQDL